MCNRVTWLEKGRVRMTGDVKTVCDAYKALDPDYAEHQKESLKS